MQQRRNKARWALLGLCATVVILGGAAWGCTNLATVNLSSAMGKPGDAITVTGTGFMANAAEMPMDGMDMDMSGPMMANLTVRLPVVIRWNGPEGPVLSTAVPDRSGTISVLFNVPETQPGHYAVVAVQKNAQGYDVYGTPARAPLQVVGPGGRAGEGVRGAAPAGAGAQSTSTGIVALTVGLGVLGLGLLAAGGVAAARTVRARRGVPAKVGGGTD